MTGGNDPNCFNAQLRKALKAISDYQHPTAYEQDRKYSDAEEAYLEALPVITKAAEAFLSVSVETTEIIPWENGQIGINIKLSNGNQHMRKIEIDPVSFPKIF